MSAPAHPVTPDDSPARPKLAPHTDARLRHLFRASLKSGRIHPLYLPVMRYRITQAEAKTLAPAHPQATP